jgi:histidinol-phosphate aminotransferase
MRDFNLERLVRPHILSMKPYATARDDYKGKEGIFLDANENSLGSVGQLDYSRYPDPMQWALKNQIQKLFTLNKEQIFLGNGSDEPIDLIIRAFCRPNIDNILLLPPTYGMYKVSAILNEVAIRNVPLTADFQIDMEHIFKAIDSYTKLIFVCSPNNPTGNNLLKDDVIKLLKNFDGLVVLDQAYADFSTQGNCQDLLNQHPNLIILRTFSKAWGMAALRLGMALSSEEIIGVLNKIKPPYNINEPTQTAGLLAISQSSQKDAYVTELLQLRHSLAQDLASIHVVEKVYHSDANFILVKVKDSSNVFSYLIDNKVIVRDRSHEINCEGCLRITVGTAAQNQKLVQLLSQYQPQV